MKEQGKKQVNPLKALKSEETKRDIKSVEGILPKDIGTNLIKNEIDEIKKWEEKIKWHDLKYKTKTYTYDFQQHEKIKSFGESI